MTDCDDNKEKHTVCTREIIRGGFVSGLEWGLLDLHAHLLLCWCKAAGCICRQSAPGEHQPSAISWKMHSSQKALPQGRRAGGLWSPWKGCWAGSGWQRSCFSWELCGWGGCSCAAHLAVGLPWAVAGCSKPELNKAWNIVSVWKHFSSVERLSSESGQRSICVLCRLKPDQSLLVRKASSSKLVMGRKWVSLSGCCGGYSELPCVFLMVRILGWQCRCASKRQACTWMLCRGAQSKGTRRVNAHICAF